MLTHRTLGAQLLQVEWNSGVPLLYLSPHLSALTSARGGVPVLFPQFANTGPLPKHGLVRNVPWKLVSGEHVHYRLDITDADHAIWPHNCTLDLHMQTRFDANERELLLTLQITNTGRKPFSWTGGLHPYFAVDDLLTSRLAGLNLPAGVDLTWTDQPQELLFDNTALLRLHTTTRTVQLTAGGFTQWMVWNPGAVGARELQDLPSANWRNFICIEPVCVHSPSKLNPGDVFEGWLCVQSLTKPT